MNALLGDVVGGVVGFVTAGALLFYLLRPEVRSALANGNASRVGLRIRVVAQLHGVTCVLLLGVIPAPIRW